MRKSKAPGNTRYVLNPNIVLSIYVVECKAMEHEQLNIILQDTLTSTQIEDSTRVGTSCRSSCPGSRGRSGLYNGKSRLSTIMSCYKILGNGVSRHTQMKYRTFPIQSNTNMHLTYVLKLPSSVNAIIANTMHFTFMMVVEYYRLYKTIIRSFHLSKNGENITISYLTLEKRIPIE